MKKIYLILCVKIIWGSLSSSTYPVLNEIYHNAPSPSTGTKWIEIYNPSPYSWPLKDWKLQTAGASFVTKFIFPEIMLLPGSFIVVGESNVQIKDFSATLDLANNSSYTAGVRLVSADGQYSDTILYGTPNTRNLPDDVNDPGLSFVQRSPQGFSLARKPNGQDTNTISDWEVSEIITPGSENFIYINLAIQNIFIENKDNTNLLHTLIHNLSTKDVDIKHLHLSIIINQQIYLEEISNIIYNNDIIEFIARIDLIPNALNTIIVEISYPHNINSAQTMRQIDFWSGYKPIIINEVQYQPLAPEPEWIEFFNRTEVIFEINKGTIKDASGSYSPFVATIAPHDFLVITRNKNAFLVAHPYTNSEKIIQTSSWAILNDSADTIEFYIGEGALIDSMSYLGSPSQRGKSYERISPLDTESNTWGYSQSSFYSTPLARNSLTPADEAVQIIKVEIISANQQLLHRIDIENTGLNDVPAVDLILFSQTENMNEFEYLCKATVVPGNVAELSTSFPLSPGYTYFLYQLTAGTVEYDRYLYSYLNTKPPVVINEIMYNPNTGEPVWLELIKNRDQMPIQGIKLFVTADSVHVPYFASDFALLTVSPSDTTFLRSHYQIPLSIPIFRGLRNLRNSGERLILKDYHANLYETFNYTPSFSPIKGISAERISPLLPPENQNWTSSLSTSTPGKRNSVQMMVVPAASFVKIKPNPFSPYRGEHCLIQISVSEQIVRVNLVIFDLKGREIIKLADNMPTPGEYTYIWNGKNHQKKVVSPGAYPLYLNIESTSGRQIYQARNLIYIGY